MANLDHGDYDSSTRTLIVREGKNGKSRMLPVGERAAAWLDRFLAESRPLFDHLPQEWSGATWTGAKRRARRVAAAAAIKPPSSSAATARASAPPTWATGSKNSSNAAASTNPAPVICGDTCIHYAIFVGECLF
jgi:integrase